MQVTTLDQNLADIEIIRRKNKEFQSQQHKISETLTLQQELIEEITHNIGSTKDRMREVTQNADRALQKIGGLKGALGGMGTILCLGVVWLIFG
ncbi:hypothetical protein SS50377_25663 [Spironucleus salmonicida]|uniref:t-SNARE coiled-coil homology domain-containing protein n=1 Tax=Spironucleus salmonicida TaxID=348837 RepID=V6LYU0_9EUKA|nr:hypothetical protein SS50377_25660 [Spironucleus salmonicida]KAH0571477.1 hypothetical protein SS50377_25663 [Spironucleus salmonicida]|eukprot:EST49438.1 Hypothetical protein SS50377_10185 [Spironucleus salmonicida]